MLYSHSIMGRARKFAVKAYVEACERALRESGLPECAEAKALEARLLAGKLDSPATFFAHSEGCATCRARAEFVAKHLPPPPDFDAITHDDLLDKLALVATRMGIPEGEPGYGRRSGLLLGLVLSAVGVLRFIFAVAGRAWRGSADWGHAFGDLGKMAVALVFYVFGFFLAGWVVDLTRPIRQKFLAYVLRGSLGILAIFGPVFIVMSVEEKRVASELSLGMLLIFAGVGGVAGAVLWVFDRMRGRLGIVIPDDM
jgi:hypothetical protein